MIEVVHINQILDAWSNVFEKRYRSLQSSATLNSSSGATESFTLSRDEIQFADSVGGYGALVMSTLIQGGPWDGRISVFIDFETLTELLGKKMMRSSEDYSTYSQLLGDELITSFNNEFVKTVGHVNGAVELLALPTLVESHALFGFRDCESLFVPLTTPWGKIRLVISLRGFQ